MYRWSHEVKDKKQHIELTWPKHFPLQLSGWKNEFLLPQRFLCPIIFIFIALSSTFTRLHPFIGEWGVVLRRAERIWRLVFSAKMWERCHLGMLGLRSKQSDPIPKSPKISSVTSLSTELKVKILPAAGRGSWQNTEYWTEKWKINHNHFKHYYQVR